MSPEKNPTPSSPIKILIIRFSSFGDIVQCLPVVTWAQQNWPHAEIHWASRAEFSGLLQTHPGVHRIWTLAAGTGFGELLNLAKELRAQNFTHIYDAHNNLRSRILSLMLFPQHFIRRSKERLKRLLLFRFRLNYFEKPFRGMVSFLRPMQDNWGEAQVGEAGLRIPQVGLRFDETTISRVTQELQGLTHFVVFAPSAAWPMKRWPQNHWQNLIKIWDGPPIVLLGGPQDHFIAKLGPKTLNLAGRLSLSESTYLISRAKLLISADTGTLHLGDLLGVPTLALIGPTAFGYTSRASSTVLEVDLVCRPCTKDGRGTCSQTPYQKCLVDVRPEVVLEKAREVLTREALA